LPSLSNRTKNCVSWLVLTNSCYPCLSRSVLSVFLSLCIVYKACTPLCCASLALSIYCSLSLYRLYWPWLAGGLEHIDNSLRSVSLHLFTITQFNHFS
jgi:hypothetical protein